MRWIKREKKKIRLGDTRIRKHFAWLPVELDNPNKTTVWLETYYTLEEYIYGFISHEFFWTKRYSSIGEEWLKCCKKISFGNGYCWEVPDE